MGKNKDKKKPTYIFGDILGAAMSKVDLRTQLEASMMSMSLMMVGLVVTAVYFMIYTSFALWYKIFLIFNFGAGLIFFMSNLVTSYQQYQNYMQVVEFNKQEAKMGEEKGIEILEEEKEEGEEEDLGIEIVEIEKE